MYLFQDKYFLVSLSCCQTGDCIKKTGLTSPAKFTSSPGCNLSAAYCVELFSPYGCDCDTRALLDTKLGKSEFRCDVTPSGLPFCVRVCVRACVCVCHVTSRHVTSYVHACLCVHVYMYVYVHACVRVCM